MSNIKTKLAQLETELIQLVLTKSYLTDKEINFKVNAIYRATDSLKKLLNVLESKEPDNNQEQQPDNNQEQQPKEKKQRSKINNN